MNTHTHSLSVVLYLSMGVDNDEPHHKFVRACGSYYRGLGGRVVGSLEHGGPQDGLVNFSFGTILFLFLGSLGYLGIVDLLFFLSVRRRREEGWWWGGGVDVCPVCILADKEANLLGWLLSQLKQQ